MNPFQKTIERLRQQQQLLALLIFGLIAVAIWIVFSLITSQRQLTVSPELQKLAKPLTPNLNREVLKKLQQKRLYSQQGLEKFPIYVIVQDEFSKQERVVELGQEATSSSGSTN